MKTALKIVAYPLIALMMAIVVGGQFLIYISGLVAIIGAFINGGVLVGLISIPLVGFGVFIARIVWGLICLPFLAVSATAMALTSED